MTSRARQLRRFLELAHAERQTLIASATGLPLVWLGLRLLGLARMQALLQAHHDQMGQPLPLQDMQALAGLVNIAARHTVGPVTCLTRSLLLVWLLRRRGVRGQLRIGVRRIESGLAAHAWVEVDDMPVNDQADIGARFLPFGELIPLRAFQTR